MIKFKNVLRFAVFAITAVGLVGSAISASIAKSSKEKNAPAIVVKCENDLAKHLNIPVSEIILIDYQSKEWPDASIGLPEHGKLYAQVITPGYRVVLEAKSLRYLYTTSEKYFRFGGPMALWAGSALYLESVMDEPNLNGNLYQCSLIGTNDVLITSGVSEFYPQEEGSVIFIQRLSRHEEALYSVKAAAGAKPELLYNAFAFSAAAFNQKQDKWAAFVKPEIGFDWDVVIKSAKGNDIKKQPIPDGVLPKQIAWADDNIMILAMKDEKKLCFELDPSSAKPEWKSIPASEYPGALDYMLNKSETLEVAQTGSSIEIARVWFTGDRKVIAILKDTTLKGHQLLGNGYLFVWGEKNGETASYTVNISTGEVTAGFHGSCLAIKPFKFAPMNKP